MPLYFAYGANMHVGDMAKRCPSSVPLGVATLPRRRWFITADGYASVAPDPRASVKGVVWRIALADVPPLDRFESVASGLYRKVSQPVITPDGPRRALVYIARSTEPGICSPTYSRTILEAARHWGLPEAQFASLSRRSG